MNAVEFPFFFLEAFGIKAKTIKRLRQLHPLSCTLKHWGSLWLHENLRNHEMT